MRLDADFRDWILRTFTERSDREAVTKALALAHTPAGGVKVIERGCQVTDPIRDHVLVATPDRIGYGWPMRFVLWSARG